MKNTERTLFFSMTYEFLEVYMPTLATLLSVITRMGRRVLAHLHSAGTFAPLRNVPDECVFSCQVAVRISLSRTTTATFGAPKRHRILKKTK